MISKRARRGRTSVETLSQGSFVASKGINETASVLSPDTVGYMKNFDIAKDGTLVLRNALEVGFTIPNFGNKPPILVIPVTHNIKLVFYAFSETSGTSSVYIAAFDSETSTQPPIKLKWVNWETGVDEIRTLEEYPLDDEAYVCVRMPFLQNTDFHYVNTVTNVILYNAVIDYTSTVFIDPATQKNLLVNTGLYKSGSNTVSTITRALQLLYKNGELTVIVVTPEIPKLVFNDTGIPADFNYALDNPYTLTDKYNQTLAQVKGMLLYLPIAQADPYVPSSVWGDAQTLDPVSASNTSAISYGNLPTASAVATAYDNYSQAAVKTSFNLSTDVGNAINIRGSLSTDSSTSVTKALRAGVVQCLLAEDIDYCLDALGTGIITWDAETSRYRWNPDTFDALYLPYVMTLRTAQTSDYLKAYSTDAFRVPLSATWFLVRSPLEIEIPTNYNYFMQVKPQTLGTSSGSCSDAALDLIGVQKSTDDTFTPIVSGVVSQVLYALLGIPCEAVSDSSFEYNVKNNTLGTLTKHTLHNVYYLYEDGNYNYLGLAQEDIVQRTSSSVTRSLQKCALFRIPRNASLEVIFSKLLFQGYPEIPKQTVRANASKMTYGGNIWLP